MSDVEETAYRESLCLSHKQQAGYLLGVLGERLTSGCLGLTSPRRLRAWSNGEVVSPSKAERLVLLYRVTRTLELAYGDSMPQAFLRSSSPSLGDEVPGMLIAKGEMPACQVRVLQAMRVVLV